MSSGHITIVCIKYHLSSVAEGRGEVGNTRLKEGLPLKADADVRELELFLSCQGEACVATKTMAEEKQNEWFYWLPLIINSCFMF